MSEIKKCKRYLKEFIAVTIIGNALMKKIRLENKLLKHRLRMINILEKYIDTEFETEIVNEWKEKLRKSILDGHEVVLKQEE